MLAAHIFGALSTIELTVSSDQSNYNLFSAAGSPSGPVTVTCTIQSGVTVTHFSTSITTHFASGSILKLVNHGAIRGSGGAPGSAGSDAVTLADPLTVDNTDGTIFGGGGGGGTGAAWAGDHNTALGGVGGNGQGPGASTAGADGQHIEGSWGTDTWVYNGGPGGHGGNWGTPGGSGGTGDGSDGASGPPGTGGAAGYAVHKNGKTLTWLGGYDSAHVKGPVS